MRRIAVVVFLTSLGVYLVNGRPLPELDCVAAPYTAWSIVRHGSLDLRYYPELNPHVGSTIRELSDGTRLAMRPPGSALAAVPVMAPLAVFCEQPPRPSIMAQLGKLAAALSVALAAAVFYRLCRHLAPSAACPATILFALGTSLWSVASQALWMHGPAALWLTVALYFLCGPVRGRAVSAAAAGLALGLAVLTRPTTAFFALASVLALLAQRRWRDLLRLCLGGAVPAGVLVWFNWTVSGDPLRGGYAQDNWAESPPLWLGLGGLLIAPSRGVLVYSPALILAAPGAVALFRRPGGPRAELRWLLGAWLVATGLTVLFYARWHDWRGGWCYGPRFLCETMPLLCLLFALASENLRKSWSRAAAVGLVAVSVLVHFVGIFGYGEYAAWHLRHRQPDHGRCLFALDDTQIEAHGRNVLQQVMEIWRRDSDEGGRQTKPAAGTDRGGG